MTDLITHVCTAQLTPARVDNIQDGAEHIPVHVGKMDLDGLPPATGGAAAGAAVVGLEHLSQLGGQTLQHGLVTLDNASRPVKENVKLCYHADIRLPADK